MLGTACILRREYALDANIHRAHLYGYSSDICRTFFPPFLEKPSCEATPEHIKEKLKAGHPCPDIPTPSDSHTGLGRSIRSADSINASNARELHRCQY